MSKVRRSTQGSPMRSISTGLLYFSALGVAGYAVFAYGFLRLGSLVHPDMKANFLEHSSGIYAHVFASIVALALGPFQFSAHLRQQYTNAHRWLGRAYLAVGVLVGGLSGLYMSQFAYGGLMAKLGFGTLAVLWLYTGLRAYLAIRQRAIAEHRKWMVRNFSLTFAAVMLRLYLRPPWPQVSIFHWRTPSLPGYVGCPIWRSQSGDTTSRITTRSTRTRKSRAPVNANVSPQ